MILNTGNRTDIPAFYSDWFYQRIKEGYVLARNPFNFHQVTKYLLRPDVVDILAFCSKNPRPMLSRLSALENFRQFWQVTITPYGPEIEPGVPKPGQVIRSFRELSAQLGPQHVVWRYDPIFLSSTYDVNFHLYAFRKMAEALAGYCQVVIISFIDLYTKTCRNFPEAKEVSAEDRKKLGSAMASIAHTYGMQMRTCAEGDDLAKYGIDVAGCMTREVLEQAWEIHLTMPKSIGKSRDKCNCLLGNDIGAYNTCSHFCRYCYANDNIPQVLHNRQRHDPQSPLLIGHPEDGDQVTLCHQPSYLQRQISLNDLGLF